MSPRAYTADESAARRAFLEDAAAQAVVEGARNRAEQAAYAGCSISTLYLMGIPSPARVQHPCGTNAAYARHWRRGEPVDGACRQAHRDHVRAVRAKRKARR